MTTAELIRAAMDLDAAEREEIARTLLASVEDDLNQAEIDAAWNREIQRRVSRVRAGEATLFSRNEADAILDQRRVARAN